MRLMRHSILTGTPVYLYHTTTSRSRPYIEQTSRSNCAILCRIASLSTKSGKTVLS